MVGDSEELLRLARELSPQDSSSRPRRLGLLGGSFHPPHLGHILLAHLALLSGEVDRVLVIPAFHHAFGKDLAPFGHRLAMARAAFAPLAAYVVVTDLERHLPCPSYTINTLEALLPHFPGAFWHLMLTSETVQDLPKWKEGERLTRLAPPLVFPRSSHLLPSSLPSGSTVLELGWDCLPPISSSELRRNPSGEVWERYVPQTVRTYWKRHGLNSPGPA